MRLHELQEQRAQRVAEMRALAEKADTEKRDLDATEDARFGALKTEIAELDKNIARRQFLDEAERRMEGQPIAGTGDNRLDAELRNYSLLRAIASQVPNLNVDAARERELSAEIARRSGRAFEGMAVPLSVFHKPVEQRVITTTAPAGGPGSNVIATTLDGSMFIDRLRNALVIRRLGARILTGLVGNLDVPRLKASATVGWVAENSALSASDEQFEKVSFTPKHAGALVEFSRNMLQQSSPDVENLVRDDFAALLAEAVDTVAVKGGGANEPDGILVTSGVGSVAAGTNGGAISYELVADLVGTVDDANATGSMAFVSNTKQKRAIAKLMDGMGRPLGFATVFQDQPAAFSNIVPSNLTKGTSVGVCSAMIYGNWSELMVGYWSEFDLLVNPYESTAYSKGNVQVRGMLTCDVQLRHPASFAAIQDLT